MLKKFHYIGKFLLKVLAFMLVIHLGLTFLLDQWFTDWLNNNNIGAEGIPIVLMIELILPLIASFILAKYFTDKKPMSNYALAMILLITPVYIWLFYVSDTSDKGFRRTIDIANEYSAYRSDNQKTISDLDTKVKELEDQLAEARSPLNLMRIEYDRSRYRLAKDFMVTRMNGETLNLPRITIYQQQTEVEVPVLTITDYSNTNLTKSEIIGDVTLGAKKLETQLRPVTVDGTRYNFAGYIKYIEEADYLGVSKCTVDGGQTFNVIYVENKAALITITQDFAEVTCEAGINPPGGIKEYKQPTDATINELLKMLESIEFPN